ncbi:MAG: LacI family DNA-binding transcriptional regulator, partial [Mycetocola sp.]
MTNKATTIADVAARAGVSVPTVSRVLTGAARVSQGKRERVENAIQELNFRPSAAARVLASRKSQVIAIIAGDTSRYGYAETIRGVEVAARAEGYTVMITVVESTDEEELDRAISA